MDHESFDKLRIILHELCELKEADIGLLVNRRDAERKKSFCHG
jgi:hypothetical protein